MTSFFALLNQMKHFLVVPVLLAGFYQWKHLPTPLRLFIAGACLSASIGLLRAQTDIGAAGFYISAIAGVAIYGWIFKDILHSIIDTRIIWVCIALIWSCLGWYAFNEGVKTFQLWVIIPYDLFMILFCLIYVNYCLRNPRHLFMHRSVFYLMLYLLMEFFVNLFLDIMSNFLKSYLSDRFMTMLWQEVLPVYNILRLSVLILIILTVRKKIPSLDKMPDFVR